MGRGAEGFDLAGENSMKMSLAISRSYDFTILLFDF